MADPRKPTQFTRESAERIARVVRAAEIGVSDAAPLRFNRPALAASSKAAVKLGTFSGAWPKNQTAAVTVIGANHTHSVINAIFPHVGDSSPSQCLFARAGTAWYLLNVEHQAQPLVYDAYLTDTSLTFTRANVAAIKVSAVTVAVSVVTCSTSAGA